MFVDIILIILGFVLLIKGADFLVDGASGIAKKFHIPEIVIGLTIVSIGTSMPELVVSAQAALEGHSDIAIGNIVGSNISNLFLILGLCAVINPLNFKKQTRMIENPITLLTTVLLFFLANNYVGGENMITRPEGFILLSLSICFIIYNIVMAKKGDSFDNEVWAEEELKERHKKEKEPVNVWKSILAIIVGIVALKFGGDLVLENAVSLAMTFGISEKIISLTIIAVSTSLPELITSVTATLKKDTDMAIGNILGSQIFNILLIIGISAVLCPINYSISYNKDLILLVLGTVMLGLFPFIKKKNYMTKGNGVSFLLIYLIYVVTLVGINI